MHFPRIRLIVVLDVVCGCAVVFFGILVTSRLLSPGVAPEPPPVSNSTKIELPPETTLSLQRIPLAGSKTAPIVVLEISDFSCPWCQKYARETFPKVMTSFISKGLVRYGFILLPNPERSMARSLASVAMCADKIGRFWEMHDLFFGTMIGSERDLNSVLVKTDFDLKSIEICRGGTGLDGDFAYQTALAKKVGFHGTPSFVLGTPKGADEMTATSVAVGALSIGSFSRMVSDFRPR